MGTVTAPVTTRRLSAGLVAHLDRTDERVVVLAGRLDTAASRPLRHLLRAMLHHSAAGSLLAVDLARVTGADGGGLAALLVTQRLASARRCSLVLRQPSADVLAALAAHRLEGTFAIVR
jgi:ABC-type transporter Mla MlaB component